MPEEVLKLYLDQMLRLDVALVLRNEGYDVLRASDVGQARADDHEILQKAIDEERILITLDEHFGDWVVLPLSRHPGVIRVKVNPTTSDNVINFSFLSFVFIIHKFLKIILSYFPPSVQNGYSLLNGRRAHPRTRSESERKIGDVDVKKLTELFDASVEKFYKMST
jgi:predicted nuclease of predicted toxin-antitoxin system